MEGARFIPSRRRYDVPTRPKGKDHIVRLDPADFHADDIDSRDPRVRDYEIEVLERLVLASRWKSEA